LAYESYILIPVLEELEELDELDELEKLELDKSKGFVITILPSLIIIIDTYIVNSVNKIWIAWFILIFVEFNI
jgi:hypothetical protein